jgi:hypothetical protein
MQNACHPDESRDPDSRAQSKILSTDPNLWVPSFDGMTDIKKHFKAERVPFFGFDIHSTFIHKPPI